MRASREAVELIKRFEGYRSRAYQCPGGVWTIGYGSTDGVAEGLVIAPSDAERRLQRDVAAVDAELCQLVQTKLYQHQWDALVSLVFNIGAQNFETSALRKLINRRAFSEVPAEWKKWRRAKGQILPGLVARRAAELALWGGKQIDHSRLPDMAGVSSPFAREALSEPAPRILVPLVPIVRFLKKLWRKL